MKISRELEQRARATNHHERRALQRIATNTWRATPGTLSSLLDAGLVEMSDRGLDLTADGKELYDTLSALGWFPPEEKPRRRAPSPR